MGGKDAVGELFDVVERGESDDDPVGIVLRVHVQPGAGRSAVVGRHGDALKVKVAAPPEGGRANIAVTDLLAETLGVAKSDVTLVSGATSRAKRFRIGPVGLGDVRRLLLSTDGRPRASAGARVGNLKDGRGVR